MPLLEGCGERRHGRGPPAVHVRQHRPSSIPSSCCSVRSNAPASAARMSSSRSRHGEPGRHPEHMPERAAHGGWHPPGTPGRHAAAARVRVRAGAAAAHRSVLSAAEFVQIFSWLVSLSEQAQTFHEHEPSRFFCSLGATSLLVLARKTPSFWRAKLEPARLGSLPARIGTDGRRRRRLPRARGGGLGEGYGRVGPPGDRHHPPHRQHQLRRPCSTGCPAVVPPRGPRCPAGLRPPAALPPRRPPLRPPHHALPQRLRRRFHRAPARQGHRREQPRRPRPRGLRRPDPRPLPRPRRGTHGRHRHAGSLRRRRGRRRRRRRPPRQRAPALRDGGRVAERDTGVRQRSPPLCDADGADPRQRRAVPGLSGGWNDLFWAVHPGGPAVLDSVEAALRLKPDKLAASRHVLSEYGNMSGPTLIFVLDEIRRRNAQGLGVMLGLGPGVSVETMLLHATGS